jgi:hypothetical protein
MELYPIQSCWCCHLAYILQPRECTVCLHRHAILVKFVRVSVFFKRQACSWQVFLNFDTEFVSGEQQCSSTIPSFLRFLGAHVCSEATHLAFYGFHTLANSRIKPAIFSSACKFYIDRVTYVIRIEKICWLRRWNRNSVSSGLAASRFNPAPKVTYVLRSTLWFF